MKQQGAVDIRLRHAARREHEQIADEARGGVRTVARGPAAEDMNGQAFVAGRLRRVFEGRQVFGRRGVLPEHNR